MTITVATADAINFNLHPKQTEAFLSKATEMLYGGATRGGKTYFTKAALIIWCQYIPGLQCFVYRKYYEDVLQNHMKGEDGYAALLHKQILKGTVKLTENTVRWVKTGSLITLGHLATDEAKEKGRGIPSHVLVFEEAGQIDESYMKFLRAWNSMPEAMRAKIPDYLRPIYGKFMTDEEMMNLFPRTIYTSNPSGPSMPYLRREFVKAGEQGVPFRAPLDEGGALRVYIEAKVDDNPSENKELVVKRVMGIGDESQADALLNANWDAPLGDFLPQFNERRHVVPNFDPPEHWFKYLSFDWGSADPFCVIWWCVSDGEPFYGPLGEELWFPRGALIGYREWYGADPKDPSKGLQMRNEEVAAGILDRTKEPTSGLVIADPIPFRDLGQTKDGKRYRIADTFADAGCPLTPGNCARIYGWNQIRGRLIGIKYAEDQEPQPLLYFCQSLRNVREYLPALGRSKSNPEDAQEKGEATHASDAVRIGVATKPIIFDQKKEASRTFKRPDTLTPRKILQQLRMQGSGRRRYH